MAYYRSAGNIPHKRHVQHRDPEGKLYYEELMGEEGFSSDSSLLYHRFIPAAIREVRPWRLPDQTLTANDPMLPRHFKTQDFPAGGAGVDAVHGRRLLLGNGDVRISYVVAGEPSPYYRNAIGDECLYVHGGTARVETVFGDLDVWEGDYVIVPRATTHRIVPTGDAPVRIYAIEVNSHITPPKRYLSRFGQLLEHSPYCERDLRVPTDPYVVEETDIPVHIKHRGAGANGDRLAARPATAGVAGRGLRPVLRRPRPVAAGAARSTFPITSPSPAASTSRRRPTRSSKRTTSSCATSSRARSTTTRWRSRSPTTTPTSTPTR